MLGTSQIEFYTCRFIYECFTISRSNENINMDEELSKILTVGPDSGPVAHEPAGADVASVGRSLGRMRHGDTRHIFPRSPMIHYHVAAALGVRLLACFR